MGIPEMSRWERPYMTPGQIDNPDAERRRRGLQAEIFVLMGNSAITMGDLEKIKHGLLKTIEEHSRNA